MSFQILKDLLSRASPLPWVTDDPNRQLVAREVEGVYKYLANFDPADFSSSEVAGDQCDVNAALTVAAVNALPRLLDIAEKARFALDCADVNDLIGENSRSGRALSALRASLDESAYELSIALNNKE